MLLFSAINNNCITNNQNMTVTVYVRHTLTMLTLTILGIMLLCLPLALPRGI